MLNNTSLGRLVKTSNLVTIGDQNVRGKVLLEPTVMVFFRMGKWTRAGKAAEKTPILDCPVSFTAADLQSVSKMNEKLTAAITSNVELHDPSVVSYNIYRHTGSKLFDGDEIHSKLLLCGHPEISRMRLL